MVIVLQDAVITDVAVRASQWSKNVAGVAEFKLKQHR